MSINALDFRSDTMTKPTAGMRAAMADAEVGDDVFQEDPTVNALEDRIAGMLGKEAAIYVSSGTMSNQIGVRLHCTRGDELICEANSHIVNYEQAAHVQLSGVSARPVEGLEGELQLEHLVDKIRPNDDHCARTRLVCLENTHNRGAGAVQPYDAVESICRWAHDHNLATHLDGARLFNATVASGIGAADWAQHFDTVNVCFSKGLGAPVGSALAGSHDLIRRARRDRKVLGGGMRQAGIIAAAALYALDHHVERLAEDHDQAQRLGEVIGNTPGLTLSPPRVATNIVIFEVASELGTAKEFMDRLRQQGLKMLAVAATRVRAVTHLDIGRDDVEQAAKILHRTAAKGAAPAAAGECDPNTSPARLRYT